MSLEEPARASMVELAHEAYRSLAGIATVAALIEAYRSLAGIATVAALIEAYRRQGGDEGLWERARQLAPSPDTARACRVARDAAYYRRYRELLDGHPPLRPAPGAE